jgi:flagellar motor switch protein FliN
MKSLLEIWLDGALSVLKRELAAGLELIAAEQLPTRTTSLSVAITVAGSRTGSFAILADRGQMHALLEAANVSEAGTEGAWEAELWLGLLRQVAQEVAATLGDLQIASVAEGEWRLGIPTAAYELRLGEGAMRIAFADETKASDEPLPGADPDTAPGTIPGNASGPKASPEKPRRGVDLFLDVELEVSLRFGSREMSLNEVLDLGPGDVVELDRHVAEPVDLLVGDKIVARGEVVLVNGNFGFNVLEVAEAQKRLESIRCLF